MRNGLAVMWCFAVDLLRLESCRLLSGFITLGLVESIELKLGATQRINNFIQELEEFLAKLAARQKVDNKIDRKIAAVQHLDNEQLHVVILQVLDGIDSDHHRAHKQQKHHIHRYEHEGQISCARAKFGLAARRHRHLGSHLMHTIGARVDELKK